MEEREGTRRDEKGREGTRRDEKGREGTRRDEKGREGTKEKGREGRREKGEGRDGREGARRESEKDQGGKERTKPGIIKSGHVFSTFLEPLINSKAGSSTQLWPLPEERVNGGIWREGGRTGAGGRIEEDIG
jgi:hypothetical protein